MRRQLTCYFNRRPINQRLANKGVAHPVRAGLLKSLCIQTGSYSRLGGNTPWQNGRIERLFGTLKPLLRHLVISSTAALQSALEEFMQFYNHARPHQNIDGLTPAQKWNGLNKVDLMQTPPKRALLVQALDGLLVGYCTSR